MPRSSPEGAEVEVTVVLRETPVPKFRSALEFLESLPPGPRAFQSWEEYEQHLREERQLVGSLTLPSAGLVYLDANPVIYSVEKHPVYGPLLQPLW